MQMRDSLKDYYKILEVKKNSSSAEIKQAHRKLALLYHPDKAQQNQNASEMFILIQEAYEILSNPTSRALYDKQVKAYIRKQNDLKLSKAKLYDHSLNDLFEYWQFDTPDSKTHIEKIIKYTKSSFFIQSCKYARACFEYEADDIEDVFSYYKNYLYNKEKNICFLLLDAAIRDDTTLFEDSCFKNLIEYFDLLMPVASTFSSKEYIKNAYRLGKFDLQETRIGLYIAVKKKDIDLLKLIIEEASASGISLNYLSKEICQPTPSGNTSSTNNPLLAAIYGGFTDGVILLLSEGYDINAYNSRIDSYLHDAISAASAEKLDEIKVHREEIIVHLVTHGADREHLNWQKKTSLTLAKEAKLNKVIPILENPHFIKNNLFLFFNDNKHIQMDKNVINIIYDYVAPKHSKSGDI